jgi:hypothetical protein
MARGIGNDKRAFCGECSSIHTQSPTQSLCQPWSCVAHESHPHAPEQTEKLSRRPSCHPAPRTARAILISPASYLFTKL